jgi:hypothetical protein
MKVSSPSASPSSSAPISSSNQQSSNNNINDKVQDDDNALPSYQLVINKSYSVEFPVLEITKLL